MRYKRAMAISLICLMLTACSCASGEEADSTTSNVAENDNSSTSGAALKNETTTESESQSDEAGELNSGENGNTNTEDSDSENANTENTNNENANNENTANDNKNNGNIDNGSSNNSTNNEQTTTSASSEKTDEDKEQERLKAEFGMADTKYSYNKNYMEYEVIYPQFKSDTYKVNSKLKEFALGLVNETGFDVPEQGELGKREIKDTYYIRYISQNVVSISMEGYLNIYGTAHPTWYVRTLTLDLKTGKEINVKELIVDKNAFMEQLMKAAKQQLPELLYEEMLNWKKLGSLTKYVEETEYYLVENGVGLYFYTSYAAGSYFRVVVPTQ